MNKKIKTKNIIYFLCWFFILLYPFNETISDKIYKSNLAIIATTTIPIFILLIYEMKNKVSKNSLITCIITIITLLFCLIDNYYIKQSRTLKCICYVIYSFLPLIMSTKEDDILDSLTVCLKIFFFEHIFATFFIQIFRDFYLENIIPWISYGRDSITHTLLIYWYKSGYNAGITAHYSTNAIYLSIASLFFYSKIFEDKTSKVKNLILTIVSFVALLLTGKRGQLVFSVMAMVIVYFIANKSKVSKKLFKFVIIIITAIILFYILSMFIPEVLNVINRFEQSKESGDILTGRETLYEACLQNWKKHKLLGNGWGFFSNYYEYNIYNPNSYDFNMKFIDAHNVYLQLLCETGIIGILVFGCIIFIGIYKNIKLIRIYKNNLLIFSLVYQLFFALYCFSGNPLYDVQCYSIFFISIGIVLLYDIKKINNIVK